MGATHQKILDMLVKYTPFLGTFMQNYSFIKQNQGFSTFLKDRFFQGNEDISPLYLVFRSNNSNIELS